MIRRIAVSVPSALLIALGVIYLTSSADSAQADPEVAPLRAPPDSHTVYLIDETDIGADSLVSAGKIAALLGAEIADNWQRLLELEAERSIEALIIHESTLGEVDATWTSAAYRRGVVLAGINIRVAEIADLASDQCIRSGEFASEPTTDDFFVVVSSLIQGDRDDVARIDMTRIDACSEEPASEIFGLAAIYSKRTSGNVGSTTELNMFTNAVASHLTAVAEARAEFESGKLLEPYEE